MAVTVKAYFEFKNVFGGRESLEVAESDAATLTDLMDHLTKAFGKPFTDQVYMPGTTEIVSHLMLMVNGRNFRAISEGLETKLKSGDEITFFPPVAGG
jgi:MoaD family protein